MNFKTKFVKTSIAGGLIVLSACSYKQMVKMAQDQEITVNPSPLELHGDSVKFDVSAVLPLNMLKKNRLYTLKTFYNYGDPGEGFEQIEFSNTEFPNHKVEQPSLSKSFGFFYEENMESGQLILKGIVSNLEKTKFKETAELDIAKGVITTSRLVQVATKPTYASHNYNSKEEIIPVNVNFFFDKGSATLKGSEVSNENGQKLDAYIASKNQTRTVTITGSHSPEGTESINSKLSENRAKVIRDFYFKKMKQYDYKNLADSIKFETKVIFQDWAPFKAKVQQSDALSGEQKKRVTDIVSQGKSFEETEKELAALSFYNVLVDNIYPALRTTSTEILSIKQKKTKAEINVLAKAIVEGKAQHDTLKVEELLYAASLTPILEEKLAIYEAATKYDVWEAYNNLGAVYMELAQNAVSLEDKKANLEKAVAQLRIAKNKEENSIILNNIAAIQLALGAREDAYTNYKAAYDLANVDSIKKIVAVGLGTCELRSGNYADAIARLSEGAEKVPNGLFNLGLAQLLSKNYDAAQKTFEAVVYANPENALAFYCKAIIGARTKNNNLLEIKLKEAISKDAKLREKAVLDLEFDKVKESEAFKKAIQ